MGSRLVGWSSAGQSLIYTQIPGDLVNMQIPTGSELGPETAFLTRFQVVLTLLVQGPHFETRYFYALSPSLSGRPS